MPQHIMPRYIPSVLAKYLAETEADVLKYFWNHVKKTDTCWIWIGSRDECGYGRPNRRGFKLTRMHRFSYELHFGPILCSDLFVLHKCDTPPCVNPSHLELGSKLENARHRDQRHRSGTLGERNHCAVLTERAVHDIRSRYTGETGQMAQLAKEYGVAWPTIQNVVKRVTWKHVT